MATVSVGNFQLRKPNEMIYSTIKVTYNSED